MKMPQPPNGVTKYIILFAGAAILAVMLLQFFPRRTAIVKIDAGDTPKQVARALKNEKIISSENIFLTLVWLTGTEKRFKPGVYRFTSSANEMLILYDIVKGRSYKIRVTIPEGYSSAEIAELLEKKGICDGSKFLEIVRARKLDGFLFPETYFLTPQSPEEYVAGLLNAEFEKKFDRHLAERAAQMKMTKTQAVILASIIEKEARRDSERPLVSAVFRNRLKKGWRLESCATVLYAMGRHKDRLTYKDTRIESPFNTYMHPGLPPAPICNPGIASIRAALYPAETDDMFFVADGSGTHIFSKYFEAHELQKKNLKIRKK